MIQSQPFLTINDSQMIVYLPSIKHHGHTILVDMMELREIELTNIKRQMPPFHQKATLTSFLYFFEFQQEWPLLIGMYFSFVQQHLGL